MRQRVVLFNLNNPDLRVEIATASDVKDARRIMALFQWGNSGWKVNRCPDLYTWGNLAMTFENVPQL